MLIRDIVWSGIEKSRTIIKILDRLREATPLRSPSVPVKSHSVHGQLLEILARRNRFPEGLLEFCINYDVNHVLLRLEEKNIDYLCKHLRSEAEVILELVAVFEAEIQKREDSTEIQSEEKENPQ